MSFLAFSDADAGSHAPISGLSLVVLEGRPAWVRRLRDQADAAGVLYTDAAGTGSAVLGTLQNVLGGVASPLVGLGGEDTAVPLFVGMASCSLIAVLALLLTRGGTPPPGSPRDDMEHSASAAI